MPLTTASSPTYQPLDLQLCDNARMLLIGVKHYEHFAGQDVRSANTNIAAWLLQLARGGLWLPPGGLLLQATHAELRTLIDEILNDADLDPAMRDAVRGSIDSMLGALETDNPKFSFREPTFENVMVSLLDMAAYLQWKLYAHRASSSEPPTRLMIVYSGHGALSGGRMVLCPSDTTPATSAPARSSADRERDLIDLFPDDAADLRTAFRKASKRGALSELLDVLEAGLRIAASDNVQSNRPFNLAILVKNLGALPETDEVRAPRYRNVITPIHLQLMLGDLGQLVTLVLDACHSGGDGAALQGTESISEWSKLGLPCRIISASQKAQLAAEATLGERRYSAATWALTRVLSRWEPVQDREAYAMGITHGNLLLRANMLLEALSFNQQLSLSVRPSRRRVSDLPFFGQYASTPTTVDPSAYADGIQLDSDSPRVWEISKSGTLKAVLYVYLKTVSTSPLVVEHRLTLFGTGTTASDLAGGDFSMLMLGAHTTTNSPTDELSWYKTNRNNSFYQLADVLAAPGSEPAYSGPTSPSGFVSYLKTGGSRRVWIKWLAAASPNPARLIIVLDSDTAYGPGDFADTAMAFDGNTTPDFSGSNWRKAEIALS